MNQRLTHFPPFVTPHRTPGIAGRTQCVGNRSALEHAFAVLLQRADESVPDPVPSVVDLERCVRVPIVLARHPLVQPRQSGAGDAVCHVVLVGVFDVDLDARAGGGGEVDEAAVDDPVAAAFDLLVYVFDVGGEGRGVFGQVGLEGRFQDAEEEVGFRSRDAVEVFVCGLAGGGGRAGGDCEVGVDVAGRVRRVGV